MQHSEENERMVVQRELDFRKSSGSLYATGRGVAQNWGADRQLATLGQYRQLLRDLGTRSARIGNAKNWVTCRRRHGPLTRRMFTS